MPYALLDHIRKLPHGRATLKQLMRELSRTGVTRNELESELEKLAARGEVVETRSGQYVAVGANREYASGTLNVHRDGYAFVTPKTAIAGLRGDIYIPKDAAERAMHGDRVVVRIGRIEADGRAHGIPLWSANSAYGVQACLLSRTTSVSGNG